MVFGGFNQGNPLKIKDIRFIGNISTTGRCIIANTGAFIRFIRCTWNGFGPTGGSTSNLSGKILDAGTDDSDIGFIDCSINVGGDVNGLTSAGLLTISGGKVVMPATYTSALVTGSGVMHRIQNVRFDATGRTSGNGVVMSTAPSTRVLMDGNTFIGVDSTKVALSLTPGTVLTETNSQYSGITPYAGGPLGVGSSLYLLPHQSIQTSGAVSTLPTGVRSVSLRIVGSSGVDPTITMPTALFPGQELDVLLKNDSGGNWAIGAVFTPFSPGGTQGACINSQARIYRFKYLSPTGSATYQWVLMQATAAFTP
jgi:hypothetical protein